MPWPKGRRHTAAAIQKMRGNTNAAGERTPAQKARIAEAMKLVRSKGRS